MSAYRSAIVLCVLLFGAVKSAGAQGTWQAAGELPSARTLSVATTLADGRILVVGGASVPDLTPFGSEVFDPVTGTSTSIPMLNPRFFAGAVTLLDGRVLVAGGQISGAFVRTAELFDPVTNTWSFAASPAFGATPPALIRLPDGRVFYGMNGPPELYDPPSNTWTTLANTTEFHLSGATVLLQDGRILMVSGLSSPAAEIYEVASNTWMTAAPLPVWLAGIRAVVLPNGKVLVAGGFERASFTASAAAFLYDPVTNTWSSAGAMNAPRRVFTLDLLPNGQVLAAGGSTAGTIELPTAELYTPETNTWTPASPMPVARSSHASARLGDRVYLFGGRAATEVDWYIRNRPPSANAGTDVVVQGCLSCTTAALVSGAGSSDPDGDSLTYTWKLGSTILLETAAPTATLPLSVGVNIVTLSVRDALGVEDTDTVTVTVAEVDSAYLSQIAGLQASLEICEASSSVGEDLDAHEDYWRELFNSPAFELPGTTPREELDHVLEAIKTLPKGQQLLLFRTLGGS